MTGAILVGMMEKKKKDFATSLAAAVQLMNSHLKVRLTEKKNFVICSAVAVQSNIAKLLANCV